MAEINVEETMNLITRNLQEVLGEDIIRKVLVEEKRNIKVYWGTAPTGRPHIGYLVPLTKIGDLLRAGCEVTILFADLHAYLDNMKAPWELLGHRTAYYEAVIKASLAALSVPLEKLRFIRGSEFELSREFTLDVYRLSSLVTQHDAKKAGAEVVKQVEHPLLSGLIYPLLQALDEQYLECDAEFGGTDQRKIFTFAQDYLPMLGYKKRCHLMNPMVPGLQGSKMSSSDPDSKIDLLDGPGDVARKIRKAFCEEGNIEDNGLLAFAKNVIFPFYDGKKAFHINRPEKYGGPISYETYAALEEAFAKKELYPGDLKIGMTDAINEMLAPIRKEFETPERKELIYTAYPELRPAPVKDKKQLAKEKKAAAQAANRAAQAAAAKPVDISRANILVGQVVEIQKHPDADTLFQETVDLGEKFGKVTVVSGLANYMAPEDLLGKKALFLQNLKPVKMRGVLSCAMILAASNEDHSKVEVVFPPQDVPVGERVTVAGFEGEPDEQMNPKKKIWESVCPDLKTDAEFQAAYKGVPLMTTLGPCKVATLTDAGIH